MLAWLQNPDWTCIPMLRVLVLCVCATLVIASPPFNWPAMQARVEQISSMPESQCPLPHLVVECISYITESYQQISLAFKDLLQVGQDQQPVGGTQFNWPSFATWASNSVGMNIRNETLQIIVKELLPSFPDWLQKLIDKLGPDWIIKLPVIRDLFAQMGRGLCGGNLHVFHEIGAKFSLFGASFVGQSAYNQSSLDAYLSTFVPGPASKGGQDQLKEAMRNYYIAMWMRNDSEQRAQHLALANALVGLQEQTELQPYIIEAFPAPFNITIAGKTVTIDIRPACTVMISLIMATETLIPTKDIPQRLDGKTWSTLVENVTLDQYASLYKSLVHDAGGPDFSSLKGTAAHDWSYLAQRMRFIVPAMRSRQDDPSIDCAVFSPQNIADMNNGIVPTLDELCFADCCQKNGFRTL